MKRAILSVLMTAVLLLGGCGETAALQEGFEASVQRRAGAGTVAFTADVTAELTDSVFECSLSCSRSGGETVVEVLAPEELSGIKARIKQGKTELEYDSLILAIEDAQAGETSPLEAMPMLMDALTQGYARSIWSESEGERELAVAEVFLTDTDYALLWMEGESFTPCNMELVSGGRAVVKCKITSFTEE